MTSVREAVLDTSVVIDFSTEALLPHADNGLLSAVTLAELAYGLHTPNPVENARRQERYAWARSNFEVLRFDEHCSHLYGALCGLVRKLGRDPKPRKMDLMIAAVAGVNQLPLLTRNPQGFADLETAVKTIGV